MPPPMGFGMYAERNRLEQSPQALARTARTAAEQTGSPNLDDTHRL